MTHRNTRSLQVSALARVEGEGAMRVTVDDGRVGDVALQIYEPPRFFEALLRGRAHTEPPDITARICGICPVAYQISACHAIEDACGVRVPEPVRQLRRLLYCGEWIESHALHIYLLHAPDFLGYPGVVELARDHRQVVERGLALKKVGNLLIERVGGRSIHPVNVRVGGFYRAPTVATLAALRAPLHRALRDAIATVEWVAGFDFPDLTIDHDFLALSDPDRYAIEDGRPRVSTGVTFPVADLDRHVVEHQVPYSTALHATLDGRRYLTGPLARYALNRPQLSAPALRVADRVGLEPVCRNPFRSIIVRAVEVVHAIVEALTILDGYQPPDPPYVPVPPRAGVGYGASEAPRGSLFHRYTLDSAGRITAALIVPPTAQNQAAIEEDLRRLVQDRIGEPDTELTAACERAIRNYDPCISCATHFLDLTVDRA
ncbi:Ni/Fe hydrogenase subunit alpha [Actinocatenispora thailandica]|uniref:Ni/Fe hydrogenase subunit alpha n=1 Tax=Actinocatenispora thailandica TaxID=227318 RepID=A0A7R7DKF4_9ACTN|nr:Ni/Fe hydrogenase subunit alpha [Actinocatenispora thailandica]BCJ33385.1 Ni/Fe hydrogenase subunit alpha [Actinocatenispora thailandica]